MSLYEVCEFWVREGYEKGMSRECTDFLFDHYAPDNSFSPNAFFTQHVVFAGS